ncbi:MAG: hypothetical protein MI724_07080, partial [Spirochaetales bacterium]|nr:hypothetical protein [Spirochaetales bacterium]
MVRERLCATFLIAIVTLSSVVGASDDEPSSDELFSRIFGERTERTVPVSVVRRGRLIGEAEVRLSPDGTSVERGALIAVLSPLVDAMLAEEMRRHIGADDFVGIDALAPFGVSLVYYPERVALELDIAPEALPTRTLNAPALEIPAGVLRPEPIAGYVNLRGTARLSSVDEQGRVRAELEPVVNLRGWVAEGAVLLDSRDDPLHLNDARLVRDFTARRLRL